MPPRQPIVQGPGPGHRFYFVHSYAAQAWEGDPDALLTWATHHVRFLAAVEDGPLSATQFHPEKSGDAGAALLANWVEDCEEIDSVAGRRCRRGPSGYDWFKVRPAARPIRFGAGCSPHLAARRR